MASRQVKRQRRTIAPADLPPEVRAEIAPYLDDARIASRSAIGIAIAARRDEAKAARTSSGIEQLWTECEEAYVGMDEANRSEFKDAKWAKPLSMEGPVTTERMPRGEEYKSTAFVRLTARYVDAGAAKLCEILLPEDDKAFSFSETPVPELIRAKDDTSQVVHDGIGNIPLVRAPKPGEPASGAPATAPLAPQAPGGSASALVPPSAGAPTPAPTVPLTVKDLAEESIELARKKAKKAEKRIFDWMVECQYTAEMRKVVFDGARVGVGILKGPYPKNSREMALSGNALQIHSQIKPSVKWVDFWNIFPDPACGENIHEGDYIFERDFLSERQLRDLKETLGYIEDAIDAVIEEGPGKAKATDNKALLKQSGDRYEVWYYYGVLKPDEMDCFGASSQSGTKDARKSVYAIVTLINDTVIRATVNPLDSGSFPYHSVPWQRRAGHWAGIGVSEQIRTPQKMVNAATRAMLNNAGKSAGCQIIADQGAIVPADQKWTITPDKIWYKTEDSPGTDVRQAFMAIEIPNVTDAMMKIIEYGLKLAEESTSIPLVTQGQTGPTTPDTFGAAQLQNNNANQLLRSIGYSFDDFITEPVVRQFYEWLLLDPDVPDDEKGEFTINAHGSVALVERAIQDQTIAQMANMVLNPVYGADPKKWFKMFVRTKRLDPAEIAYTEEEQKRIDSAPPPVAPQVQAAQIRAAVDVKKTESSQASESHKTLTDATVKLHDMEARRQLALLEYANAHAVSLTEAKVELAKTAMTLDAQRELNAADHALEIHKHTHPPARPVAEPPGRAKNGEAFES